MLRTFVIACVLVAVTGWSGMSAAGVRVLKGIDPAAGAGGITVRRGLSSGDRELAGRPAVGTVRILGGGEHPLFQSNRVFEDAAIARVLRGLVAAQKFTRPPAPRALVPASVVETPDRLVIQRRLLRRAAIKLHPAGVRDRSLIMVHPAGFSTGRNIIVHRAGGRSGPSLIGRAISLDQACPVRGAKTRRPDGRGFCGVVTVHPVGFKDRSRIRVHRAGFR